MRLHQPLNSNEIVWQCAEMHPTRANGHNNMHPTRANGHNNIHYSMRTNLPFILLTIREFGHEESKLQFLLIKWEVAPEQKESNA